MNTKTILVLMTVASSLLVGCQNNQPPEHPLNTGDRPRIIEPNIAPEDEILPILKITEPIGGEREMKLRSQTSRFSGSDQKKIEITLSSSRLAFCDNENPDLKEKEEQVIITVESTGTVIVPGETANSQNYTLSGVFKSAQGEKVISDESFTSLTITDINNAIARGNINISSEDISISGEFFSAICK
jgi:hypothetical protein